MKKNKAFISLLFFISLTFTGCKNLINNKENIEKTYAVNLSLLTDIQGAIPEEFSQNQQNYYETSFRSAFPLSAGNTIYYKITATAIIDGNEKNVDYDISEEGTTVENYTIRLTEGIWSITAKGYTEETFTNQCFEGTVDDIEISDENPAAKNIEIIVNPTSYNTDSDTATGSVNLEIQTSDTTIKKVVATWKEDEIIKNQTLIFSSAGSPETPASVSFTMKDDEEPSQSHIPSGSYDVTFSFYSDDSNAIPFLSYFCTEKINIFDSMITNTWKGNAEYFTTENNQTNFCVTSTNVSNFVSTDFYVKSTGSDSSAGKYLKPFKTLSHAINAVNARASFEKNSTINSVTKQFTIYVLDDVDSDSEAEIEVSSTSVKILLNIEGVNSDSQNPSNPSASIKSLSVDNSAVTIKNIDLAITSDNTDAISITSDSFFAVDNSKITGNISSETELSFVNSQIEGDISSSDTSAFTDSQITGNITSDTVTFTDSQITGNIEVSFPSSFNDVEVTGNITINAADSTTPSTFINTRVSGTDAGKLTTSHNIVMDGLSYFAGGITHNGTNKFQIKLSSARNEPCEHIMNITSNLSYNKFDAVLIPNDSVILGDNDLNAFSWISETFVLAFNSNDTTASRSIILANSSFIPGNIPVYNIQFQLKNAEFIDNVYTYHVAELSDFTFEDTTVSVTLKKSTEENNYALVEGDSVTLSIFSGTSATPIYTTKIDTAESDEFSITANLYPGNYTIKISALIEGIPYSQQISFIVC